MVKINNKLAMVGRYRGNTKIDFEKLKKAMDAKKVELASEYEFQEQFPGCKLGANATFRQFI